MSDGKTILTIDDDPDVLESLKTILEAHGYSVLTAASAEEGLRAYKDEQPDMIIVDLMMEEVDAGTNFVKEVKVTGSSVPIFLLSSMGNELAELTDYSDLGLNGVLQKPIKPDHLLTLVRSKIG
ncbi:MAG: response regulator [Planctomycetota bacterium]